MIFGVESIEMTETILYAVCVGLGAVCAAAKHGYRGWKRR